MLELRCTDEGITCRGVSNMNAVSDISMKTDDVLKVELEVFRR